MAHSFQTRQRPDEEVIELLESVLLSARQGHVRTVHVLAVNSINQVEIASAGDLTEVKTTVLLGGLTRSVLKLTGQ